MVGRRYFPFGEFSVESVILYYLLAFLVGAATIVVHAAVSLTAMYLIVFSVVWLAEWVGRGRRRRELGLPRTILRYRSPWIRRRFDRVTSSREQTDQTSALAAMETVHA